MVTALSMDGQPLVATPGFDPITRQCCREWHPTAEALCGAPYAVSVDGRTAIPGLQHRLLTLPRGVVAENHDIQPLKDCRAPRTSYRPWQCGEHRLRVEAARLGF